MKHIIATVTAVFLAILPASAVLDEKNFDRTLSVLHYELKQEFEAIQAVREKLIQPKEEQDLRVINVIKKCNELALILYSQNDDCTFDITYALNEVTDEYERFTESRRPYNEMAARLSDEIERYDMLISSLQALPTEVDSCFEAGDSLLIALNAEGLAGKDFSLSAGSIEDRDSCLFYANGLLNICQELQDAITLENKKFDSVQERLKKSYDYAQARYKNVQRNIFINGQDDYLTVLSNLKFYLSQTPDRYGFSASKEELQHLKESEWKWWAAWDFLVKILIFLAAAIAAGWGISAILNKYSSFLTREENRLRRKPLRYIMITAIFTVILSASKLFITGSFYQMASNLILGYIWMVAAIVLSLFIRKDASYIPAGLKAYLPVCILGLIIGISRINFISNRVANLVLPLLLIAFTIWQLAVCLKKRNELESIDKVLGWITFTIMALTTISALIGYVLMSVLVIIWWLIQLAAMASLLVLYELVGIYEKRKVNPLVAQENKSYLPLMEAGANIRETWFIDFLKIAVLPIVAVLAIPQTLWEAAATFDLTSVLEQKFFESFFSLTSKDGEPILDFSCWKIVVTLSLFFLFRYINYILKAVSALLSIRKAKRLSGRDTVQANEVNLTLSNNVIAILVWGTYIITLIILLSIPVGAISIVAAGLATGVGLAMKDILNNFIYGIQLMSGRLRVGDYIECDGIRGKVSGISYQSTQVETVDGAIMSFLNADLFSRNFKNLTRNDEYEFLKIIIGVAYGTDIEKARSVILEALKPVQQIKDAYGHRFVDNTRETTVVLEELADSSVNLAVKQYALVSEKNNYRVQAQESIYNALAKAGIEIPFPQLDIHKRD